MGTRRWEMELRREAEDGPGGDVILGRAGTAWSLAGEHYVSFTVWCDGKESLVLTHAQMGVLRSDLAELDEALRRIPALDVRSAPADLRAMLDDPATRCFVGGCRSGEVDARSALFVGPFGVAMAACRAHRDAIEDVLADQQAVIDLTAEPQGTRV